MRSKLLFVVLFSLCCFQYSPAQKSKKVIISGTVLGADKNPISNAIIMIDNEKTNSLTNAEGKYKIKVKPEALKIGVFTFGNGLREEDIGGRMRIDFNFSTDAADQSAVSDDPVGDEAVNSGYRVDKRKYVTNEVSKIDGADKKFASYSTIYDMIQREVSGVQVQGTSIIIQESRNMWGYVAPLLIVDGVTVDSIEDVRPNAVKSIEVLKGTSAAMYGTRGYGGVIIITTKTTNN
jgi:TonB-dependent SusC/RagA subfamily outer membrane receptor